MDTSEWLCLFRGHPIFRTDEGDQLSVSLLQSTSSLSAAFEGLDLNASRGRGTGMCLRGSDIIVPVKNRLRMMSLVDAKATGGRGGSYKTLNTPTINFEIHQMALNPTGKLLAVAGTHQVAVIVLPRAGYSKLVTPGVDCSCVRVGQFHHAISKSSRLAKLDWHPLSESGSSLVVLTEDGVLREYNISEDVEEPQQTVSFFVVSSQRFSSPPMSFGEYGERAVSFCFGQGWEDWGSLTIYVLSSSGDVRSVCPFMPTLATLPVSLIDHLIARVSENQNNGSVSTPPSSPELDMRYEQQMKFLEVLRRLESSARKKAEQSPTKPVSLRFPKDFRNAAAVQGPYLLQPAPLELDASPGGDATDLIYVEYGASSATPLSVLAIVYGDGKVDVCLDLDKAEAKWSHEEEQPALYVYETIDLGLVSSVSSSLPNPPNESVEDLLFRNHPVFLADPVYEDTFYIYHDFGVHCLVLRKWLSRIQDAINSDNGQLLSALQLGETTEVACAVNTLSSVEKSSSAITGVAIVHDVYLSYSLLTLTSSMQLVAVELTMRDGASSARRTLQNLGASGLRSSSGYVSVLGAEPFVLPEILTRTRSLPSITRISAVTAKPNTPEALRVLAKHVEQLRETMRDLATAGNKVQDRITLQGAELKKQVSKLTEVQQRTQELTQAGEERLRPRIERVFDEQKKLLSRADRVLQRLMDNHQPILSEPEKKWFDELRRMKDEVVGGDDDSLTTRAEMLALQLATLQPDLKFLSLKEEAEHQQSQLVRAGMGSLQLSTVQEMLAAEAKRLQNLQTTIEGLNARLHYM